MELGEVHMKAFSGAENIAQFVAFACSVEGMSTSFEGIHEIGRALGRFSRENPEVREISVPLLGAGAGGLRSEQSAEALSSGFKCTADSQATLTIHVLQETVYGKLVRRFQESGKDTEDITKEQENRGNDRPESHRPLRVFISYSGTDDQHKKWVADFGEFLRAKGVNARLDQWHLRAGMDLPQWMTNELTLAERVVIISDERYAERAAGRTGGVGWETKLIQGDMMDLPPDSTKYITIVREKDFSVGMPRYLKTKHCIHWKNDADQEGLRTDILRELYNIPKEPPIGVRPAFDI